MPRFDRLMLILPPAVVNFGEIWLGRNWNGYCQFGSKVAVFLKEVFDKARPDQSRLFHQVATEFRNWKLTKPFSGNSCFCDTLSEAGGEMWRDTG